MPAPLRPMSLGSPVRLGTIAALLVALAMGAPRLSDTVEAEEATAASQENSKDVAGGASPLKALLVTGGCCHDYDRQRQIIENGLTERLADDYGRDITFDIHQGKPTREDELALYRDPDWAADYDIVIHNECYGAVLDEAFVRGIVAAHERGVPGVFIHCSMHSYRDSPAADRWRELIGVTSRRHESKHPLAVVKVDDRHPIMRDFPDVWHTEQGELYVIEKVWPRCTVLATAYGSDTKRDHPVIWVNETGGETSARLFGTTIGHHNATMETETWLDLLARGTLWAVGELEESSVAANDTSGTPPNAVVD